MEDKSVKQLLTEIARQLQPISELSLALATQAELQAYTEDLYNQLVQLAYEGMDFLNTLQAGDVVSPEWIARRDELLIKARRLVLDAPNAQQ